ncbi:MAG: 3-phosphoshikimate 1-carboxyvinyltransferase [Candidatus Omnitrophota bacterium]
MDWDIKGRGKALKGETVVPPDKSISHRAVMFGAICRGKLRIKNFLFAEDCMRTFQAFRELGCDIEREGDDVLVSGKGLKGLKAPDKELYLGNSGTTMRIISGIIAGAGISAVLTGDASLSARPMARITIPLGEMGFSISTMNGDLPPVKIEKGHGPIRPIDYRTPVASAQVKSCVLAAGLYAPGVTSVTEPFQSRDHTERMLRYFSAGIERCGLTTRVTGRKELAGRDVDVPGDISSAAFFIVASSVIEGSQVILRNVGLNPTRTGIIKVMTRMGADIEVLDKREGVEPKGDIRIRSSELKGTVISQEEIPLLIDEVPALIVAALKARGETLIEGISELKVKESDRVKCMSENLKRMGYEISESRGALIVPGAGQTLLSAELDSYGDHRIAMSMAVAALLAEGESRVKNTSCVDTSYPGFMSHLNALRGE